jgi:hypothetical protein
MTAETINPTGYTNAELRNSIDMDAYAVRNEAERRGSLITKKLARLYKQIAEAEKEQIELNETVEAAWKEIHR